MKPLLSVVALSFSLSLAGCAEVVSQAQSPGRAEPAPMPPSSEGAADGAVEMPPQICPMQVGQVGVRAIEATGGGALEFTTTDPTQVDELRERLQAMVAHHDQMRGMMDRGGMIGRGGMMGRGGMQGMGPMMDADGGFVPMPASSVTYEEAPGGGRLVFRAQSEDDVTALRQHLAARAERMRSGGTCPRGMMHMRGMEGEAG